MSTKVEFPWHDFVTLFVPIFSSLLISLMLIWARSAYSDFKEKRTKQEFLWRVIKQNASNVVTAIQVLKNIATSAESGNVRLRAFDIPQTPLDFARDLAELDPKNSYIYADFISLTEICKNGFLMLTDLMKTHACSPPDANFTKLGESIKQQALSLSQDLVALTSSEVTLMKAISGARKKFDPQDLARVKQHLEDAQREVSKSDLS